MAIPGWQNLIVCDGVSKPCDFLSLIILVKALIADLVFVSTFLAVIAFAYAGITLLGSSGNPSGMEKAKSTFKSVLIGYLWILAAWVVVYTITSTLLNPGYSFLK